MDKPKSDRAQENSEKSDPLFLEEYWKDSGPVAHSTQSDRGLTDRKLAGARDDSQSNPTELRFDASPYQNTKDQAKIGAKQVQRASELGEIGDLSVPPLFLNVAEHSQKNSPWKQDEPNPKTDLSSQDKAQDKLWFLPADPSRNDETNPKTDLGSQDKAQDKLWFLPADPIPNSEAEQKPGSLLPTQLLPQPESPFQVPLVTPKAELPQLIPLPAPQPELPKIVLPLPIPAPEQKPESQVPVPFPFPTPEKLPKRPGADSLPPFTVPDSPQSPGRLVELFKLDNRAADHRGPDAVIRIPPNFDPNKPINLVIFNHGWGSTARGSYSEFHLDKQMSEAPPNTVLIIPEWQETAGASNGQEGDFKNKNQFRNMLQEIFNKTAELKGKTLNNVGSIDIISHSAGYNATGTELYKNGLEDKIRSVTMLDSSYEPTVNAWLKANIDDLVSGKKQFINIYAGTAGESQSQIQLVREILTERYKREIAKDDSIKKSDKAKAIQAKVDQIVYADIDNPKQILDTSSIAANSIVFKRFNANGPNKEDPHYWIPKIYIGRIEAAAAQRKK